MSMRDPGTRWAIDFVQAILRMVDARSVLDVGTATGRGLREIKETLPGAFVCGIEPVAALLEQAMQNGNAGGAVVVRGSGRRYLLRIAASM